MKTKLVEVRFYEKDGNHYVAIEGKGYVLLRDMLNFVKSLQNMGKGEKLEKAN